MTFKLGPWKPGFYDETGQFAVEPGPFNVRVGDTSGVANSSTNETSLNVS